MRYSGLLIALLVSVSLCGQTVMQSVNSSSSLLMGDKLEYKLSDEKTGLESYVPSQISLNVATKDKKLSVENLYHFQIDSTDNFFVLGMNSSAKINNSISSVFDNNNVVGGVKGSILLGFSFFKIKNKEKIYQTFVEGINNGKDTDDLKKEIGGIGKIHGHWIYINPSIEGRKLKQYFPSNVFDSQLEKTNKTLWSVNIGYNYWTPNFCGFNTILGVSFTPKYTDNFTDLNEFTLVEQKSSTNDTIQRVSSSKTTVYQGEYEASFKKDLNFEAFLVPNKIPTFGLYLGYLTTFEKDVENLSTFSTGIFFSKPKKPTNPSIGIVVNFKDIHDNYDLDSDKKFTINFVTKLNIGKEFK